MVVVVVGGGVMGASVAYQLALKGTRCVVLEASTLAHGASGNAAGIIGPPRDGRRAPGVQEEWYKMRSATFDMHKELAASLPALSGVDYGWNVTPSIGIAVTEEEEQQARRELAAMEQAGIPVEWLTPDAVREATAGATYDGAAISGGVLSADPEWCGSQVEPSLFTRAMMAGATSLVGSELREGCRVDRLLAEPGDPSALRGVALESGEEVLGEAVVLTMGPWSAEASAWLGGLTIPVSPLKGQILRLRLPNDAVLTHRAYRYAGHFYVGPQANGEVWVGTTEEADAGFDTATTDGGRQHINELLQEISSSLSLDDGGGSGGSGGVLAAVPEVVKQTACLRPATSDGMPVVGAVPGKSNAFFATGHGAVGIQLSPVTGLCIAQLITSGECSVCDLSCFSAARFEGAAAAATAQGRLVTRPVDTFAEAEAEAEAEEEQPVRVTLARM